MIAMERGRKIQRMVFALAALGAWGTSPARAQSAKPAPASTPPGRAKADPAARPAAGQAPAPSAAFQKDTPGLQLTAIPVNPTDAIATVNGEAITRQQLADECVSRKGKEILETLVARKLIEQELRKKKLEVSAVEIDQEIDNVAMRVAGIGREAWLRTLDKERGISPVQYARDIIYPALALRKLSAPAVQVTPQDIKDSFEAQYGDKLRCRIIMVAKPRDAQEIWEELRKNPGGFEKLAQERSMDSGSRSLGGLLAEPIARHAHPQTVSDAAFAQLVDGDPDDKDPKHKPKDGDFTGPIQVAESTWVLIRREGVIPARNADPNAPDVRKSTYDMIFEVKLKEKMNEVFVAMMQAAAIDNKLTGQVKLANEQLLPESQVDGDVKLMGGQANQPATRQPQAPQPAAAAPRQKLAVPAAANPDVIKETEALTRPPATRK